QLAKALKVKVTDEDGVVLEGAEVKWSVKSGGGRLSPATSISDANGIAQSSWTLGDADTQEVEATVTREDGETVIGSPVLFKASNSSIFGTWELYEYHDGDGVN